MLDPAEISGPDNDDNHSDGALFDEDGDPVYCQFMSMHWAVNDAKQNPERRRRDARLPAAIRPTCSPSVRPSTPSRTSAPTASS